MSCSKTLPVTNSSLLKAAPTFDSNFNLEFISTLEIFADLVKLIAFERPLYSSNLSLGARWKLERSQSGLTTLYHLLINIRSTPFRGAIRAKSSS